MVPMRTIPMEVIAILGLNSGDFPRRDTVPGFNLIAKDMKKTDRSKNLEDRYLLLETLLAAKKKLMIFYKGQSEKDNSEVFPTPPLAELIQYLNRLDKDGNRKAFLVKHNLQSYADAYFDGSDTLKYSYSATAFEAATAKSLPPDVVTYQQKVLDLSEVDYSTIELPERLSLNELEKFFRSPIEYYLFQRKFGSFYPFERSSHENNEIFLVNALDAYDIKRDIVEYAAEWVRKNPRWKIDFQQLKDHLTKTVRLPYQNVGEELFKNLQNLTVSLLADEFLVEYSGQIEEAIEVVCTNDSGTKITFTGTMAVAADHKRSVMFQNTRNKPKHHISPWLRHLFLSVALPEYTETVCQFEDGEMTLKQLPQETAQKQLLHLAQIRALGAKFPIPFFREVAQVNELPTEKQRKSPIETADYGNQIVKALCGDYCASIFFKHSDVDSEFRRRVCHAVNHVYNGREIK